MVLLKGEKIKGEKNFWWGVGDTALYKKLCEKSIAVGGVRS